MIGQPILDAATLAVSLFNTMLLLWLGLTVLLTAQRRTPGLYGAGIGLLLGAGFFTSHTAILGHGLFTTNWATDLWWRFGWGPVLVLPFAWYAVVLWYGGYWDDRQSALHRRHRVPLIVCAAWVGLFITLFLLFAPLPSHEQLFNLDLWAWPAIGNVSLLVLIYPLYNIVCIGLSVDALRHPAPPVRVMADLARRRARPWMLGTAGVLLTVSLLIAAAIGGIVFDIQRGPIFPTFGDMSLAIEVFDLLISLLIATANVLLGQAMVAYEIFTGNTLPRRGLWRQWRSVVLVAAGYSGLVAVSLTRNWYPISAILLATLIMTLFYALFSWQAYVERDHYMRSLRPFVASERLYDELLGPTDLSPDPSPQIKSELMGRKGVGGLGESAAPFEALCADLLGTLVAYLVPLGPLSPLVGPALAYPADRTAPATVPTSYAPGTLIARVDPPTHGGAEWAVPLWSQRGLIGVLLLGEKRDGGLYSQEEIEIARASGERLIDTEASAALAGRLMALQRRHLAESGVLDRRARRTLHDDILPLLHTAMLTLSAPDPAHQAEGLALLAAAHRGISDLLREMPTGTAPAVARLGLVDALRASVAEEWPGAFDGVTWAIAPAAAEAAAGLPPLTAEVLFYAAREAVRNAARYARPADSPRPLHLHVALTCAAGLELTIDDDGVGLTGAPSQGSGQGLALHSTLLAIVGGTLATAPAPSGGTRVTLHLPGAAGGVKRET
jgi:signal transduction histidine kinase